MAGTTAEQLLESHADKSWRTRFVELSDLIDILRDCIIAEDYSIPDDLNNAIVLTERGNALKSRLIRKEEVPAKEAHLMCALVIGHDELFLDVDATDIDALAHSIGRQVQNRQIRFPFIFSRDLYDAFADLFEEEKDSLSTEETIKLLDKIPPGVFQYGRFVVGPSGISRSSFPRALRFSKRVPAFHCSDPVCRDLHSVMLNTAYKAEINAQREKLEQVLEASAEPAADWSGLAMEINRITDSHFGNHWHAPVVTLLGDCLSLDELRLVLSSQGSSAETLSRPDAIELALLKGDRALASAIDALVQAGDIRVSPGEIRAPISTAHLRSGAFRLRPQLGSRGVRFVSGDVGLPTLRQRELVKQLYLVENEQERNELEWQLRSVDGVSLEVRLDDYIRTRTPAEALTRLVLARSSSAIAASEIAGLGDLEGVSDDELIARLTWKLGFEVAGAEDAHASFWRQHERLSAIVQSWLGAGPGDASEFRGQASTYFSTLEGLLEEALAFAAWSLLRDHMKAPKPFSYDNEGDRDRGFELLQEFYAGSSLKRPKETLRFTGRLTMFTLARGFGVLSEALESIRGDRARYRRPRGDFPEYATRSALQRFPFESSIPFLDLAEHSQERIIDGLAEVERTLDPGNLSAVRNDYSHYRRTSPELAGMETTLESVGRGVRAIENLGFGLNLCQPSSETTDRWGRSGIDFVGPRSLRHTFARPSSLEWVGLPSLRQPQYLVRAAAFDDANEVLRFTRQYEGEFARMWNEYPKPRKKSPPTVDGAVEGSTGD